MNLSKALMSVCAVVETTQPGDIVVIPDNIFVIPGDMFVIPVSYSKALMGVRAVVKTTQASDIWKPVQHTPHCFKPVSKCYKISFFRPGFTLHLPESLHYITFTGIKHLAVKEYLKAPKRFVRKLGLYSFSVLLLVTNFETTMS